VTFRRKIRVLLWLLPSLCLFSCAGTDARQTGQLQFVTIDEELELGEELASFSIQHLNIIRNRSINRFLDSLALQIGQVSHWQGLHLTIFVINEPDVNHFSLPGGNIYLFRGLLETTSAMEEVAAVLAHEIAHLAMRDGVARLAEKYGYSFAAQQIIGDNPEIAEHIIRSLYKQDTILDYPAEQEYSADQNAVDYLQAASLDASGLYSIVKKFEVLQNNNSPQIALLSATHPAAKLRLEKIRKVLPKNQPAVAVSIDSNGYQKMKELLIRLSR
jgi:beta-barrel assembly-enhancing protease